MPQPARKQNSKGAPLGQHFLTRPEIAGWVADAVALSSEDTVLEVGPGHGILTRELLKRAGKVVAVEKDPALAIELRTTFAADIETGKLVLLEEDIRSFDPSTHASLLGTRYSLVANIPYYITGLIIRMFLTTEHQPHSMALLVQKEVVERIVVKKSKPFDSTQGKESLLSLSVKAYGTPRYVKTVKAGSFSPPPKVDSAILAIENISRSAFADKAHEERFFTLLRAGFAQKRKLLASNLAPVIKGVKPPQEKGLNPFYSACGIEKKARAEELTVAQWLCLAALE